MPTKITDLSRAGAGPRGFNKRVKAYIDSAYNGNVSLAARETGIPRNSLWQIYKGFTRTPSASILVKLSSAMGVTIDFLIKGE